MNLKTTAYKFYYYVLCSDQQKYVKKMNYITLLTIQYSIIEKVFLKIAIFSKKFILSIMRIYSYI